MSTQTQVTWNATAYQSGTQTVNRAHAADRAWFYVLHLAADTEGEAGRYQVSNELCDWLNGGTYRAWPFGRLSDHEDPPTMSTPTTIKIENIVLALIQTQAPFTNATNAPTANYDDIQSLLDKKDILYVQATNPIPLAGARKPSLNAPVLMSTVTATIRFVSNNTNKINDWEVGLDTALTTTNFSGTVTNLTNASFPNGFEMDVPEGGDRQSEGSEQRIRTRVMRVVFRP